MALQYRLAPQSDATLFDRIAEDLFDRPIDKDLLRDFLSDPRHHILVADEDGEIVGFVSSLDYVHPDKPRQLWINEVGVAPTHRGRGIGKGLIERMIDHARSLGCSEAWVLTDPENAAANMLYAATGARSPRKQLMYSYSLR